LLGEAAKGIKARMVHIISPLFFWILICLIYERLKGSGVIHKSFIGIRVILFFLISFGLAAISMHFFWGPAGDEYLYDLCGRNLSALVPQGIYWNFPPDTCAYNENFFVKITTYIYILSGKTPFSLVGFNCFLVYVACDLMLKTFRITSVEQRKIFNRALFFPPIVYLAMKPGKEAIIAFLLSLICYLMLVRNRLLQICSIMLLLIFYYFLRWQHALAAALAIFIFSYGKMLFSIREKNIRSGGIALSVLVFALAFFFLKDHFIIYLYSNYINPHVVEQFASRSDGPFIYRLMVYKDGVQALHPWNVFIAHLGGFFTPHPLRFLKEALRDGQFQYSIVEEFLFVSFWFFTLIPVFFIYLRETLFLARGISLRFDTKIEFFKLILASLIFSMACFSLFFHTPQLFRYKVPLNIYLFLTILVFIDGLRKEERNQTLQRYRFVLAGYSIVIITYSGLLFFR
jgi:hypothetical protein